MLVSVLLVVSAITLLAVVSKTKHYSIAPRPGAHLRTSTDVDSYFGSVG